MKKIWIKNLVGVRKTSDFWRFGEKRNPTCEHVELRMGIFKNVFLRNATSFSIQIFFIGLRDEWTSCKRDFWVGGRFFTLIGGGFLAENQKNHFFALYGRSKNRPKKARFWPSRSSKVNGWGGCVLCFQVAVHRGLMSISWWIYRFGGKRLQLFFAYFHQFPCATERWSPAQLWRASKAEPLWFQVALGVTYKHTQKQPWAAALGVW